MKKLLITSTDVMMYQFLLPHALYLSTQGYQVDVACSFAEGYKNEGYHEYIANHLPENSNFYSVNLERSPFAATNIKGFKQLSEIINNKKYDLIWTNEPVMGVLTRLAAYKARKKYGTKLMYLAHGYHFYEGAPKKNWIAYPIEKVMSYFCDSMCMINWEDYHFTQKHFPYKPVFHIDGIGLDTQKFKNVQVDKSRKRKDLGFTDDDILLLSVGELQTRKNHEPVIRAVAQIDNPKVKYIICGRGELEDHFRQLAKDLNIEDRLFLLGHRYDISEILKSVDIFIHPSLREGLGIAVIEAMSAGLPLITSNVQGMKDYVINEQTGYVVPTFDISEYKKAIEKLIVSPDYRKEIGENNINFALKYDFENSKVQVLNILNEMENF